MKKINLVLIRSLIVNTLLVLLKIFTGLFYKSKVLIADGIHSLSDLSTDIVCIFGNYMSQKESDENHPFGHGKIEYLTSIIIGLVIIVLSVSLMSQSFTTKNIIPSNTILYVTLFTIIIKYILASYIEKKGKLYKNSILIASGKESRADVLTSIIVVVTFIFSKLTNINKIFIYSENVGTIIVSIIILKTGYNILKENIVNIIGSVETDEDYLNSIRKIINNNNIEKIDELEIMKYGSYYQANITISLKSNLTIKKANKITNKIKNELINKKTRISYVKISINSIGGK